MHQSPQKKLANRRDKYTDLYLAEAATDADAESERRMYRASQPKARRLAMRDEPDRGSRWSDRQNLDK